MPSTINDTQCNREIGCKKLVQEITIYIYLEVNLTAFSKW